MTPEAMTPRELQKAQRAEARRLLDQRTLKALRGYYSEYRVLPTLSELCARIGVHAKSWGHECVNRLEEQGYVVRMMPGGRLAPGPRWDEQK
jgi:putative hemolysin